MIARVVFACVQNAGRSQMAAAFFNAWADPARARAVSAGTRPAGHVHPAVLQVMAEQGFDLSACVPQCLTPALAAGASHLVTMGCSDECPLVPEAVRDDWPLRDPGVGSLDEVRQIRDDVARRVSSLIAEHGWGR